MTLFQSNPKLLKSSFSLKLSLFNFQSFEPQIKDYIDSLMLKSDLLEFSEYTLFPGYTKNLILHSFGIFSKDSSFYNCEQSPVILKKINNQNELVFLINDNYLTLTNGSLEDDVFMELENYITTDFPISRGTFKLCPIIIEDKVKYVFRGIYKGDPARFNLKHADKDTTYLVGTENIFIDAYQVAMTSEFNQIKADDYKIGNVVIFDSFPRENIKNKNYRRAYSSVLDGGRDCLQVPLENFGETKYYTEIAFDNIIFRPQTWVIKTDEFAEKIFDKQWRENAKIPNKFILNIFGGLFRFDSENKINMNKFLDVLLRNSLKKIDLMVIEEDLYTKNILPFSEVFIGFSCE